MYYIVKCPKCEAMYQKDRERLEMEFACPACGKMNTIDHLLERREKVTDEIRTMEKDRLRKNNLRRLGQDDSDISTIKSFSMEEYPIYEQYDL